MDDLNKMNIGIIGLGWLGKSLAEMLALDGQNVAGTVTSSTKAKAIQEQGIKTFVFRLGEDLPRQLQNCRVIVITVPPRGSEYIDQLNHLAQQLNSQQHVIFISSTSVYPDTNGTVVEGDEIDRISPHSGISLYQAETSLKKGLKKTVVLRMAGLCGPGREPGRFLAGRSELKGPGNPVNLVYLSDCIGVIKAVMQTDVWGEDFNVCADEHPTRKEFYVEAAKHLGLEPPQFSDQESPFKLVCNKKSKELLNYTYQFPNPMDMLV